MFEIYCDESRPEVIFGSKEKLNEYNQFMLIGGIWLDAKDRNDIKEKIKSLKIKHNAFGEIKWKNVSPSKLDFYLELIDLFFYSDLRFRCILINGKHFDSTIYHNSDDELGFYKFYYQLIYHWLEPLENYAIFLDHKKNRLPDRLHVLNDVLNNSSFSFVNRVQAIPSKESVLIQLADLLMGAVGYKFHNHHNSSAKLEVIKRIETHLGHPIRKTYKNESKFNIFQVRLK